MTRFTLTVQEVNITRKTFIVFSDDLIQAKETAISLYLDGDGSEISMKNHVMFNVQ